MIFPDKRRLFTSAEVCHACGISRTSLFRLEEIGFLKPYRINPDTGYRYYDLQNITAVGQFQRLQGIGLSKKEIVDVYHERVNSEDFLQEQRRRLNAMQRFLDKYELCHSQEKKLSRSYTTIPAVTCYCEDIIAYSPEEAAKLNYLTHLKCVENCYQLLGSEPLFGIFDDPDAWTDSSVSVIHYTLCIPVIPNTTPSSQIRRFDEVQCFSIVGFGDYSVFPVLWEILWDEVDKRKL